MSLDTRLTLLKAVSLVISNYTMPPEPYDAPGQVLDGSESCARLHGLDTAVNLAILLADTTPTFQALISASSALLAGFVVNDTSHGPQQVLCGEDTRVLLARLEEAAEAEAEDIANNKGYFDSIIFALREQRKAKS